MESLIWLDINDSHDSPMKVIVHEQTGWEEYARAWNQAMQDLYWYKESPVFDFNRDEELSEMKSSFGQDGHIFLAGRDKRCDTTQAVVGYRYDGNLASLRRWEPAVPSSLRATNLGRDLLKSAIRSAKRNGAKRLRVLVKHPHGSSEAASWHVALYEDLGFKQVGQTSVDLTMRLTSKIRPVEPDIEYEVITGEALSQKEMADYIIRAYTSTPEDMALHQHDLSVTVWEHARQFVERVVGGHFGPAPNEFRRVLLVQGQPAAHVGAFVIDSEFKPLTGVLGPVGVFPEYRRKGIARFLVAQNLEALRMFGCEFAAVGTGEANDKAIKLYEKIGFRLSCVLRWFEARV